MNLWKKVKPVVWPILGVVILLMLMVVVTKSVWKSKGTPKREVVQTQNDHSNKFSSKPNIEDLQPSTTVKKKSPSLPTGAQPELSAPTIAPEFQQPSITKSETDEYFPVSTDDRFPLGLDGFCPVTLVHQKKWQKGDSRWSANHQGRTFQFVSYQQQQQFLSDATRYSPVATGNDVVIEKESNRPAAGNRNYGVFYQDRIYLFAGETTLKTFLANPARYIQRVGIQPAREQASLEAVKDSAGYMNIEHQSDSVEDDCCCRPCRRRLFGRRCW